MSILQPTDTDSGVGILSNGTGSSSNAGDAIVSAILNSSFLPIKMLATVKYVGMTRFASGYWVGVQLDRPVGENDGSIDSFRYFSCAAKYGAFVRIWDLALCSSSDEMKLVVEAHKKSASLLKLKISQMMDLLNQQLEIAEFLEDRMCQLSVDNCDISAAAKNLSDDIEEISQIISQETVIISKYDRRFRDLV